MTFSLKSAFVPHPPVDSSKPIATRADGRNTLVFLWRGSQFSAGTNHNAYRTWLLLAVARERHFVS
ncbi:hypothetical protein GOB07_06315 [Sinorhizobium meliloti]|uniref:hypothetical protein n=1 Tax=Rhizobium meliloti TaxID=382 RepID=UPI001294BF37|nr:hypothetical protein [Sinorhizobium meliloti]MDW9535720.1 hypothetical protein [Sinorhizobium meliloti]MQX20572.1 hypothetical protein [Sinorhizobium meliloti]